MKEKQGRRRLLAGSAATAALLIAMMIPATAASAYTWTGCSWSTGGTGNVTWQNDTGAAYTDTATAAASSWANTTDVNNMSPSGGSLRAGLTNSGANGYAGYTTWSCNGNRTLSANATLNRYYTDGYSLNKRKAVWVHEFGHALGLNHSSAGTIMYTCPGCTFDSYGYYYPVTDDKNGMNSLY